MKYLLPIARTPDGRIVCRVLNENPLTRREVSGVVHESSHLMKAAEAAKGKGSAYRAGYSIGRAKLAREKAGAKLPGDLLEEIVGLQDRSKKIHNAGTLADINPVKPSRSSTLEKLRQMRATGKGGTKEYMALMRGLRKPNPLEAGESRIALRGAVKAIRTARRYERVGLQGHAAYYDGVGQGVAQVVEEFGGPGMRGHGAAISMRGYERAAKPLRKTRSIEGNPSRRLKPGDRARSGVLSRNSIPRQRTPRHLSTSAERSKVGDFYPRRCRGLLKPNR